MDHGLAIGTRVMLRDLHEHVYPSRLEAVGETGFTVMRPVGVPASEPYEPRADLDVLWTDALGLHVSPTELTEVRTEGRVRLWELTIVAEPWLEQRRDFVRVPVFGRVTLRLTGYDAPDADLGRALVGYLIDFSEVAIQCCLFTDSGDSMLATVREVECDFVAHGTAFHRIGRIYGMRPSDDRGEALVVVRFDQTEAEATALRREVFAAQVDMRHTWRRRET